jgi:hypothetical protein
VREEIKKGVWRHYKDKLYLVLGVARHSYFASTSMEYVLGIARHSETGALWTVGFGVGEDDDGRPVPVMVVAGPTPAPRPPASRYLVAYVPLYDTGNTQMAVRPVEMWQEEVEVSQGETAYTPAKTVKVPRFKLVREY